MRALEFRVAGSFNLSIETAKQHSRADHGSSKPSVTIHVCDVYFDYIQTSERVYIRKMYLQQRYELVCLLGIWVSSYSAR